MMETPVIFGPFNREGAMRRFLIGLAMALAWAGVASAEPGAWHVEDKVSALDNTHEYLAMLRSDETLTDITGQQDHAVVAVGCGRHGLNLEILWPDFVMKDDPASGYVTLQWKVGDGVIQKGQWTAATRAAGRAGADALSTLKDWSAGAKVILRVPDQHGGHDVTFHISGLTQIVDHVSQTGCG